MEKVARRIKKGGGYFFVGCAYLEITPPSIGEAIEGCARKGADRIFILPYFLLKGRHTQSDIPRIVRQARKKYSGKVKVHLCQYLGYHEKIVEVVRKRIRETR